MSPAPEPTSEWNASKLSSKASSRILGKVLAELNSSPSQSLERPNAFPDFSDTLEPDDNELPEWATEEVDRSAGGSFKDGAWQSDPKEDGRGKVTWKKNRPGHHARYQKRRQQRETEKHEKVSPKREPLAAGMIKPEAALTHQ
eukprot:CAMPEP_0181445908 /NCGR_PEP_ID=MMETSP1110-20121109/25831_1 /TAXON_ID=174948 /ORGANISM="Symbiodinium sp., Strain CCMP421" /LENGTH=142 /DNA_ID=CAMNT_0023569969 /DNA_START=73 /DNA_END=501 /DNA_ORIENTATION=+